MAKRMPLIVSCASVLIVLFYLVEGRNYPLGSLGHPGPGLYPMLVGAMMLIATSMTVVEAGKGTNQAGISFDWPSGVGRWRVFTVVFAALGYTLLLDPPGGLGRGVSGSAGGRVDNGDEDHLEGRHRRGGLVRGVPSRHCLLPWGSSPARNPVWRLEVSI